MKILTFIFLIGFSLSVFQNGCVLVSACMWCRIESVLTNLNASVTKPNTDKILSRNTLKLSLPNSILVKNKINRHIENDFLASIKTAEDLIKFISQCSLTDLSPAEKESVVVLITAWYGSMTVPVPPAVTVNLVSMFAHSPKLFSALPRQCLYSALSILTANRCALCSAPTKDTALFLKGFLSLSPGVLHAVPRSVFVTILGTVSSAEMLNDLPHAPAANLITALSLSKSSFNCLPLPTVLSLLTYTASKSPAELIMTLPPSTVFGFLDGLLDTLDDPSSFALNTVPTPALVAILSPVMTSRILSVMPIGNFDMLLSVIGSSHALPRALPLSSFISVFNILITSPKILSSLNPDSMAKILTTVVTCPSILDGIPANLMDQLLDSITVYLPSSLSCMPANEFSLLFRK